ncbi:MAG: hypothetical protein MJE77_28580 [Proteobacteria bacterium]|nr:hypothetical protein [Pseudomonadota bacterium]
MSIVDSLRLVGSPETNRVMKGELIRLAGRGLGRRPAQPDRAGSGALIYPFDAELAYLAVRYHRTATRVLWDLYTSRAGRLEPLYDELHRDVRNDGRAWLWNRAAISVQARNVGAFPAGSRQIVGTVKNAILDGARAHSIELRVDPHNPDIELVVRMHDDALTVSIDLAGASLSRRGYRIEGGRAPLREHLAAVLCMLARHDPRRELVLDPMCGSGTICIEAALMARGAPLWPAGRAPAMLRMPLFHHLAGDAGHSGPLFADTEPLVIGNDIDSGACRNARDNAASAGLTGAISWQVGHFRDLSRDRIARLVRAEKLQNGLILCNPPYGQRLGDKQLGPLYRDLSRWCGQFRGWRAAFLIGNPAWDQWFGRRVRIRKTLRNGPIRVNFCLYDL